MSLKFLLLITYWVAAGSQAEVFVVRGRVDVADNAIFGQSVTVRLLTMSGATLTKTTAGLAGSFEFPGIPSGSYQVVIELPDFQEARQTINVPTYNSILVSTTSSPRPRTTEGDGLGGRHTVDVTQLAADIPRRAIQRYQEGLGHIRAGRFSKAVENLETAITLAPNFYNAHLRLANAYSNQ